MQKSYCRNELLICEAAKRVFITHGLEGARMQDIADEAGMNKAMLHYYFRSKEKLFHIIFEKELENFFSNMKSILAGDASIQEKILRIIEEEMDSMLSNPRLPMFIFNELSRDPDHFLLKIHNSGAGETFNSFSRAIRQAGESGQIKPVHPEHLFLDMMSLIVYPFISRPVINAVLKINNQEFGEFIQERKRYISALILESLTREAYHHEQ
ncbi:MAG: TetR/AcrR family transcriptional regulator [Bacteroidia bacterium]|nr:TetR/AcrR family transcriptional regulator [Bacteroidia bacterium]